MLLFFSAIIFLFSSIALISCSLAVTAADRILYGVAVQQLPLGGLTQEEAQKKLEVFYEDRLNAHALLLLQTDEQNWEIRAEDIDFQIDTAATAAKAYQVGRDGSLLENLWTHLVSAHQTVRLPFEADYNKEKLLAILQRIAAAVDSKTENAYCSIDGGVIAIHPEIVGKHLDTAALTDTLEEKLHAADFPTSVLLPIKEQPPEITADQLHSVDALLAAYTSHFNPHNVNRSENIKIAAGSVNKLLVKPQQIISFNNLVGLRVAEAGFKEASVIVEGRTVPDIGGGVCQVSSTLYNAILLADLKPVERTPHFHPLGYVPIGLDATVADNLLDFKFQNTLPHNVYVITEINGGTLTVSILGSAADQSKAVISLASNIDKTLPYQQIIKSDDRLPPGKTVIRENGITGYIVSSYRIKTQDGQEISRELLYVDEYTPENEIIAVGKKKTPAAPKAPTATPSTTPRASE